MICGYARVSSDGRGVAAQVEALTAAEAGRVFRETASGAKTIRDQLRRNVSTTLIHPVREFKLGPLASFEAG